jgi:DNA primase
MAGRIRDEDLALVRERSAVEEVIGEYLQLRNAGSGSLKGLCPFHDEKTPSFNVTPSRGMWYCFSCTEGGDVITFVRKIENLTFTEAIERLAARAGIELRYEQGGTVPGKEQSQRRRLLEAHRAATEFYIEQLGTPAAIAGQTFLSERGFEAADAQRYRIGYAPAEWDALSRHLRGRGFTEAELLAGGLASEGRRGLIDKFRGRLMWPIADLTGDVIAFGARKLRADDDGPKYLNTPETVLFKKSSVLYGADMAKRDIAQHRQAVVVEGYTDVMACHLAGVTTAVATSGTSFGDGHIKVLRRLVMDTDRLPSEFIFTFDGDNAGQRAALRAFAMEDRFVTQTFVAVQPDGLDPCDLRIKRGDAAVRELIAGRVPLFEFSIRDVLSHYDLDTNEGRLAALDSAAQVIGRIKDPSLRDRYAISLDRWLGLLDEQFVLDRVRSQGGYGQQRGNGSRRGQQGESGRGRMQAGRDSSQEGRYGDVDRQHRPGDTGGPAVTGQQSAGGQPTVARYDESDPVVNIERQALKLALQRPALCGPVFDELSSATFTIPAHAAVRELIAACGGVTAVRSARDWAQQLRAAAPNDNARAFLTRLTVEPLEAPGSAAEPDARYADEVLARVEALAVSREIATIKSRLQRLNPVTEPDYNRLFGDLVALEQRKKVLTDRVGGAL